MMKGCFLTWAVMDLADSVRACSKSREGSVPLSEDSEGRAKPFWIRSDT
jgi:hypothetical protein